MKRTILLIFTAVAVWMQFARPATQAADFFQENVAPLFAQHCLSCHGAAVQRAGLDLRNEQSTLKGGGRGPAVKPGDPAASLLYRLITHAEEPAMPLGRAELSAADTAVIARWIAGLAKGAIAVNAEHGPPVRDPGTPISAKDRQFWSFVKPVRPAVPAVKDGTWGRNEIDAFVLAKLEAKGLRPAAAAAPALLLRRVYLDLTGLPPVPEETEAFVQDPSDAAYAKVIDKLLGSQHYGERWGRHWLDLARYADSGGYEFDYDRPHAWRYRDWVIKAFNDDQPYDQFVRAQLAGDQLRPAAETKPADLIPTGFCRNGPTVDNATNEQTRSDELDDIVTTTSAVFLGLTVGCARCHDHKYDPIPQRDYYRMQAVFFPFQKTEKPLVADAEAAAHKAANKAIDEQVKPYRARIIAVEKRVRDLLLAEKTAFHVKLAESAGKVNEQNREEFRRETAARFAKQVNLQAEEIDPLLTAEEKAARKTIRAELEVVNQTRPKPLPQVMCVTDKEKPEQAFLLKRGDIGQKGEPVGPGLPAVLAGANDLPPAARRRQLADWITSQENPLTARVAVNRIWQYHFGRGIVRTPSDFGVTGDRPSHPELLDWLADELVKRGWSWKAMHRLMLLSSAYRQASEFSAQAAQIDPENRLLWRMPPRRLEAEVIRDGVLAVSGKLNPLMGGPGIYPRISPEIINTGSRPRWPLDAKDDQETWRRSVYIFVKRSVLLPLIEVFDCPATTVSGPVRSVSTVSPQALALMNNEFVLAQAGHFARRVEAEAGAERREQVGRAFRLALNRPPSERELNWSLDFLQTQTAGYAARQSEKPAAEALRDLCHALFNLNEFLYVD